MDGITYILSQQLESGQSLLGRTITKFLSTLFFQHIFVILQSELIKCALYGLFCCHIWKVVSTALQLENFNVQHKNVWTSKLFK